MSRAPPQSGQSGYYIWIVTPPGYIHSRCFEETALALSEAFAELGYAAPVLTRPDPALGTAIVLGANLINTLTHSLPAKLVLFNLEQVHPDSPWFEPAYVELLRRHTVWDYSQRNIATLAGLGVKASLCGIGYTDGLTRIPHSMVQDVDVAFVGSDCPRRHAVLAALHGQGFKVHAVAGLYGADRDALYSRAKIVLNLHYHEAQVFEIVRVSYLLANRICVVSEVGLDHNLEDPFARGVAFAYYGELVEACRQLLQRPEARRRYATAGFEAFKAMPQAPRLQAALETLSRR